MNRNLLIFLVLFALSIALNFYFELPNEILNFSLSLTLLLLEYLDYTNFNKRLRSEKLIVVKSSEWMGLLPMTGFMIYWFSDEPMNFWNVTAIVGILIYGTLAVIQNFTIIYEYGDNGIRNLRTNKLKEADNIKAVDFNNEKLAIHTDKSQNDLVIIAKKVKSPTWEELTTEMSKFNKN